MEKMGIENAMPALMLIVGGLLIAYGAVLGYRKDVKLLPLARVPKNGDPKEYVRSRAIVIAVIGICVGMGAGLAWFGRSIQ